MLISLNISAMKTATEMLQISAETLIFEDYETLIDFENWWMQSKIIVEKKKLVIKKWGAHFLP